MRSLSAFTPEDPQDRLILTEKERGEFFEIDNQIYQLQAKKLVLLRILARAKGIAAEKLEDLKSRCGAPFVLEAGNSFIGFKRATAMKQGEKTEYAYLCHPGCGWVKGVPNSQDFNNLGPLSGAEGEKHYCKICKEKIGETITKMS